MKSKQRKQILLIAMHPVGGIRTYFRDVYSHLLFDEFDFIVLVPKEYISDLEDNVFIGKRVQSIAFNSNTDLVRQAWKLLNNSKIDLVHSHGFTAGVLLSILPYIRDVPHLMTAHDVFQDSQFKGFSGFIKRGMISLGLRLIDCNMAVSNEARDNIHDYFPFLKNSTKLIAIQNGIDVGKFNVEKKRDLHQELELADECILFGFFGRFMKQKGFRLLVDAVGELRKNRPLLDFRIIAFGWGGFIREEQSYIKSIGLDSLFLFMPHTDDMSAAIRGVDAVVMPSLWEACPLLPMEVMVSGVPLIASNCIGLREVVTDTPAIVIELGDVTAITKALLDYSENPSQHIKHASAFSEEAYGRFDVSNSAKELYQQYQRMIA